MPIRPEAEREHRVLGVARVVVGGAVRGQDREVGLAAEARRGGAVQERRRRRGRIVGPGVLEPALADLAVGAAVDPALRAVARAGARGSRARSPLWENANRPAGSTNGWVSGSWSVLRRDGRRRWTSTLRGLDGPSPSRAGSSRNARVSRCVSRPPSGSSQVTPQPKPAMPVALEPLGERPQLVEPEGRGRSGDELLTHRADHRPRPGRV